MFASRDVCIHFGKETWSHLRCYTFTDLLLIPIQGVYYTFKHGMFRVGGSCNVPILCAHFLWKALTKKNLAGEVDQNMNFLVSPDSTSLNLLWSIDQKHPNALYENFLASTFVLHKMFQIPHIMF